MDVNELIDFKTVFQIRVSDQRNSARKVMGSEFDTR